MGACDASLSHFGLSDLEFPLKSDLTIYETLIPGMRALSSPDLLDVEFPSDEAILEAMIMDFWHPPVMETLQVGYQRGPLLKPSIGLYLENYYA
jgi:hypothetical protein